ncbi:alkaline phosphatase [Thiobacillus denitrificans]|uniref:alkaline phosphatase n=1 Tax=Thiobacillus denitrificans TaxID=36861 RepID=UPI00075F468B|nr:alkaline phosphatase [Thiobacillus denitrificans]
MRPYAIKLLCAAVTATFATAAVPAFAAEDAAFWYQDGQAALAEAKRLHPNMRRAKNVIFFVGDGMGVSTVTAARILEGQLQNRDGERNQLAFERLPYLALSKTYSVNQQTPDSAPTMTAMVSGIKTNDGMFGIAPAVQRGEKDGAVIDANKVASLLQLAERAGRATGVVTTARVTHATPGATYAHTSERNWERDTQVPAGATARDIASQLIDNFGAGKVGDGIEVVLGGGRREFLPNTLNDPEDAGAKGRRGDGRNLAAEFERKFNGQFVWDKAGFDNFDPASGKRLLGLFAQSHMEYEHDRANDTGGEPSIAEMTGKAIEVLKHNDKGFFLMVEGGRIDHAHHAGNAYRALTDTIALSDAVRKAMEMTDPEDTLIVVSADHSHVFTIAGYPKRGNPILGKVVTPGKNAPDYALAQDGNPYTTVSYANGRGYHVDVPGDDVYGAPVAAGRVADMRSVDTTDPDFHQEALVPLSAETHAGEDVAIYAGGPKAHLFHGTREQNYIFHVMQDAFRGKHGGKDDGANEHD